MSSKTRLPQPPPSTTALKFFGKVKENLRKTAEIDEAAHSSRNGSRRRAVAKNAISILGTTATCLLPLKSSTSLTRNSNAAASI